MAQWSQQPGARGVWHAVVQIKLRPDQANNWVVTVCKRQFPEKLTQDSPPGDPDTVVCPFCNNP